MCTFWASVYGFYIRNIKWFYINGGFGTKIMIYGYFLEVYTWVKAKDKLCRICPLCTSRWQGCVVGIGIKSPVNQHESMKNSGGKNGKYEKKKTQG